MSEQERTELEIFEHYIVNPEASKRERKYLTQYIFYCLFYLCYIIWCYVSFPAQRIGGVPLFCILTWIFNTGHYFHFICYRGAKMLDLKKEKDEGWLDL